MKRWWSKGAVIWAAAGITLVGCTGGLGGSQQGLKQLGKDEQATIKVMSNMDERYFYQVYGALFSAKYPNIDVQVVSTQGFIQYGPDTDINKEHAKFIDEQKPDVLFLSLEQYEKMAEEGRLYELDTVIKQDKFDLEGILPNVIEAIKSRSSGKLYGLAPGFNSQALFYNKTLFEKNGVPLPKDQMSWEELFEAARRFPTTGDENSRIYGFGMNNYSDSLFQYVRMIGDTKGLSFVNPETGSVTIQTDAWKKTAQLALDALKSGAVYRPTPGKQFMGGSMEEYFKSDPFIAGKVAMTISGNYLMDNLKQAKTHLKDQVPEWDMVTIPVDPQNPESSGIMVNQIFAVNAQSQSVRAAWEFVKYINGNEYARVTSKSSGMGNMPSRIQYLKDPDGRSLEPFYKLKGDGMLASRALGKLPSEFYRSFSMLGDTELKAALEGKKTVDEALKLIQEKGQEELIKAKQAEEAKGKP
ncbi:ABC transporter substrate-binding protein [Paenibacillus piri]|uniref:Extracellular solute-binding protein n=1 Tax=Paenibacillus piri TaxID=2547395 RepID=A0A4V2ZSZ0_9BACL|nr:extracellular solute-binding protein [Paenibacillus piri]TDF95054.1 extracellular solute-binding protein [Paenibacillus piri]